MVKQRRKMAAPKKEKPEKRRLKEFLHKKAEGRQNRYVFKGFREKLSGISAKIGLNSSKNYNYLQEDEATRYLMGFGTYEDDEEKVQLNSNFIAMVQNASKQNASSEFTQLLSRLKGYTPSLVLLKKDEIIDKIMEHLHQFSDVTCIDLLIALVKDLRSEISFETLFLDKIFPKIMTMINVLDLELLEKIMHFFSYCFKFMMPTIIKNFDRFYKVYFEVLNHKNKFVKKFASESLSYILRKAKKEGLAKMVYSVCLKPIRKPYKFLNLKYTKRSNLSGDTQTNNKVSQKNESDAQMEGNKDQEDPTSTTDHDSILYAKDTELADPAFCKFEKSITKKIHSHQFIRKIEGNEYEYEVDHNQRLDLIATLSTVFVEATYGVQKRLYTDWKTFLDVLLDLAVTPRDEFQDWYSSIFRYTIVNMYNRLNDEAIHELSTYLIQKVEK